MGTANLKRSATVLFLTVCLSMAVFASGSGEAQADEQEVVTIRFTSHLLDTGQAGNAYVDAIERFEDANPDIDIEIDFLPTSNFSTGIRTRVLGGEQLDVVDYYNVAILTDISRLSDDVMSDLSGTSVANSYGSAFLAPVTFDGTVLAVPETMNSNGLIFNATLFEELGLEPASNWAEFLALCADLQAEGYIPLAMAGERWVPQFIWAPMITDNGGGAEYAAALEAGEVRVNDANSPYRTVVEKLLELESRGFFPEDWLGLKQDQSKDLLAFNRAGMLVTGTWDLASLAERNPENEYGVMVVPGNDSGMPTPIFNIGVWRTVAARSEHREQALRFVEFMNGPENLVPLSRQSKSVPVMEGIDVDDEIVQTVEALVRSDRSDMFWPHYLEDNAVYQVFNTYTIRILSGDPLDATLGEMQSEIDALIATD